MTEHTLEDIVRRRMNLQKPDRTEPAKPDRRTLKEKLSDYTFVPSPNRQDLEGQALIQSIHEMKSSDEMLYDLQHPNPEPELRRRMHLPAKVPLAVEDRTRTETLEDQLRERLHLRRRK